jgi:hypothetical protein
VEESWQHADPLASPLRRRRAVPNLSPNGGCNHAPSLSRPTAPSVKTNSPTDDFMGHLMHNATRR